MARDMHKGTPLPKPPPGARAVRAKPYVGWVAFSTIALATMVNGFFALEMLPMTKYVNKQVGGHFQFLTIDGLAAACVCMALGIASDMLPGISVLRLLKRAVLLIALPVSFIISSIYWTLLTLAPTLILPASHAHKSAAAHGQSPSQPAEPSSSSDVPALMRIPMWIDVSLHAVPMISLLAVFFLREKKYQPPASTWGALAVASVAGVAYGTWAEYCAEHNGSFPYPFLTISPLPVRCAIYVSATGFALLAFWGLNALHK